MSVSLYKKTPQEIITDHKNKQKDGIMKAFVLTKNAKLFEGIQEVATRNPSGEVDKRRSKNKAARKARKLNRR